MTVVAVSCPSGCAPFPDGVEQQEINVPDDAVGMLLWECPRCMGRWLHDTGIAAPPPPPVDIDDGVDHHVFADDIAEHEAGN